MSNQREIPCVLMRAGTSKGPFFHARDLPADAGERDALLIRVMGSPDLIQIDGLGGSRPITSKIAIVSPSQHPDADVDYLFAQVDVERSALSFAGNCGNISSGVGPFAIDEGLVTAEAPVTTVRIHNVNTGKVFAARVQVEDGRVMVDGDFAIPGVPGTGAEIVLDYTGTIGAKTGLLLPTGRPQDRIELEDGSSVRFTVCDVGNPSVWLPAEDLGMGGSELADRIDGDAPLLARVLEIRGKVAAMIGLARDWRRVDEQAPGLPTLGFVAPPADYVTSDGRPVGAAEIDLRARMLFMGRMHESMAGTSSQSLTAASRITGSVVAEAACIRDAGSLRIGHPLGSMKTVVDAVPSERGEVTFRLIGFSRTARRLMKGVAFVPKV